MRLLLPLLCLLSSSSCLAALAGSVLITTSTVMRDSETAWREGAAREAELRALHAKEAAAARKHYNELMRDSLASESVDSPAPLAQPTPPPLVQMEPVRVPLRPR